MAGSMLLSIIAGRTRMRPHMTGTGSEGNWLWMNSGGSCGPEALSVGCRRQRFQAHGGRGACPRTQVWHSYHARHPPAGGQGQHANQGSQFKAADAADQRSTCGWCRDMFGVKGSTQAGQDYYDSLFRLYASWGVDFVKVDDLSAPYHRDEIEAVRNAIDKCGRSIVFSRLRARLRSIKRRISPPIPISGGRPAIFGIVGTRSITPSISPRSGQRLAGQGGTRIWT